MVRLIAFNALLIGACGYALLRGKTDARIIGAVCIVANFATFAVVSSYASVETDVLIIDLLTLVAFTLVALRSDRFWPLWVSGFQLTTSLGHLMKAVQSDLLPIAYAAALRFWSYPILIVLAVGVWRSERRARARNDARAI